MSRDAQDLVMWLAFLFWTNTSTPLDLVTQNIIVLWIMWSSYSFRFLEQSVIISSLIPVRKVPYPNCYLKQHIVHPVLQMWMHSNFDWYNMKKFYGGQNQPDASECLMMLIELINKGSVPYRGSNHDNSTGVSLSEFFSFMLEEYIFCMWTEIPLIWV